MTRYPDWRERLHQLIESRHEAAFSWATNNGGFWAADCINAMTGVDVAADYRGSFVDELAVKAFLLAQGGLEAFVTGVLGEPLPGVLCVGDGDIVMAETTAGLCLGVCEGAHGIFVSDIGLTRIRLRRCTRAWKVG